MKTKTTNIAVDPDGLAAELERERLGEQVQREDALERVRAQAAHSRERADVAAAERLAGLERAEREQAAESAARLARMYAAALEAGERTRIAAGMARSGEARALRLEQLRGLNLKVLTPVLLGFAVWSTTGVQHGAARLMAVTSRDPMWWALWLLEPVLIGAVVWVICARARLAASGGRMAAGADRIAVGCLMVSILLNLAAGVPAGGLDLAAAGAMAAHAIGPVGAAMTAHLIGTVDASISAADPWTDERGLPVPVLAEMDLRPPAPVAALDTATRAVLENDDESGCERPAIAWPVPIGQRRTLPVVARSKASGTEHAVASRPGAEHQERPAPAPAPGAVTRRRPNKGHPVPASARKNTRAVTARAMTDDELAARLAALVEAETVPADASIRTVQDALGIGFERAKRVLALTPGGLTVTNAGDAEVAA